MIKITGCDLIQLAKKAYELSSPQGMGFLHYTSDPLNNEEAKQLIRDDPFPLDMDYIKGRSIKLHVRKIDDYWYDHTDEQYQELLKSIDIDFNFESKKHNIACNCLDCRNNT